MTKRLWITVSAVAGLATIGWLAWGFDAETDGMDGMRSLVRSRFPRVRQVAPAEAAAWLASTNTPRPQLLDVRTAVEFGISHLPGARRVEPHTSATRVLESIDRSKPLLVYCAVGYRSSDLANRLITAGFTNVANLEGSIFAWANEGRPLEAEGRPVRQVHPYNRSFGKLLKPECRASTEDVP